MADDPKDLLLNRIKKLRTTYRIESARQKYQYPERFQATETDVLEDEEPKLVDTTKKYSDILDEETETDVLEPEVIDVTKKKPQTTTTITPTAELKDDIALRKGRNLPDIFQVAPEFQLMSPREEWNKNELLPLKEAPRGQIVKSEKIRLSDLTKPKESRLPIYLPPDYKQKMTQYVGETPEISVTAKRETDPYEKFRTVYLPGGKQILPDQTKPSRLVNVLGQFDPEATKLFEKQKTKEKPKNYLKLKEFQKDLDDIEYLDKKYSTEGSEYNADDERKLRILLNKRNTLVGIHTGLTYGELEDYKLFNAYKKIEELKGKSDFQKDLRNVPEHIYSGVLGAINTLTGGDFDTSVKSDIRKELTNLDIGQKYKAETQPKTLFGQVVQGLTTTATLAPLFAFGFSAGGVKQGAGYLKNLLSAAKGSALIFAPGGVAKGIQESEKEVSEREKKGEELNVFDRAWIFTKNTGGETLKNTMEGISEMMIPGFKPGKTLLTNLLKKSTLSIATETGTEQITDITGDLIDGTNTSLLVSLARTSKFSPESINQFLIEAIIAGLYGSTVGGAEFWGRHLQQGLTPEEYKILNKYVEENKKKLEGNLSGIISDTQEDINKGKIQIGDVGLDKLTDLTKEEKQRAGLTIASDPRSRLIVNQVEKQVTPLLKEDKFVDEKIITDKIKDVIDSKEQERLAIIYKQVLEHNKKYPKQKEISDAERIRRTTEETGGEEGLVGKEIGDVRVRDIEKDRLEAEQREETEAGKRPLQEGIEEKKLGSTQVNIPKKEAKQFVQFAKEISDEDVYKPETEGEIDGYGRETEPHVTALYGLKDVKPEDVKKVIEGVGDVELTLGKTSIFENDDYDVLKIDVESPKLGEINKLLKENLDYESDFPDYKPHLTIAYLQKGKGKDYVGNDRFEGQKIKLSELLFSDAERNKTSISLKPPPKAEKPAETGKQAWEMTKDEFGRGGANDWTLKIASKGKVYGDAATIEYHKQNPGKAPFFKTPEAAQKWIDINHKKIIQQALSEGEQVPENVLRDYPELQKKTEKQETEEIKYAKDTNAKIKWIAENHPDAQTRFRAQRLVEGQRDEFVESALRNYSKTKKEVEQKPISPDNNKEAGMRMLGEGKKDTEITKALNLTGRQGIEQVREWRREFISSKKPEVRSKKLEPEQKGKPVEKKAEGIKELKEEITEKPSTETEKTFNEKRDYIANEMQKMIDDMLDNKTKNEDLPENFRQIVIKQVADAEQAGEKTNFETELKTWTEPFHFTYGKDVVIEVPDDGTFKLRDPELGTLIDIRDKAQKLKFKSAKYSPTVSTSKKYNEYFQSTKALDEAIAENKTNIEQAKTSSNKKLVEVFTERQKQLDKIDRGLLEDKEKATEALKIKSIKGLTAKELEIKENEFDLDNYRHRQLLIDNHDLLIEYKQLDNKNPNWDALKLADKIKNYENNLSEYEASLNKELTEAQSTIESFRRKDGKGFVKTNKGENYKLQQARRVEKENEAELKTIKDNRADLQKFLGEKPTEEIKPEQKPEEVKAETEKAEESLSAKAPQQPMKTTGVVEDNAKAYAGDAVIFENTDLKLDKKERIIIDTKENWIKKWKYDPIVNNLYLLKLGDEGYEEGKTKYRTIQEGGSSVIGKAGTLLLSRGISSESFLEEITHNIQQRLGKIRPELAERISEWEQGVRDLAKANNVSIYQGEETFAKSFIYTFYNHQQEAPNLAPYYQLPKKIFDDFSKILNTSKSNQINNINKFSKEGEELLSAKQQLMKTTSVVEDNIKAYHADSKLLKDTTLNFGVEPTMFGVTDDGAIDLDNSDWKKYYGYDPIEHGFKKLKQGDKGYVEGKEIYRGIPKSGAIQPSEANGWRGTINVYGDAKMDDGLEENLHIFQAEVGRKNPELAEAIKVWELEAKEIIEQETGEELTDRQILELFPKSFISQTGYPQEGKTLPIPQNIYDATVEILNDSFSGEKIFDKYLKPQKMNQPAPVKIGKPEKGYTFEGGRLELLSAQAPHAPPFFSKMQKVFEQKLPAKFHPGMVSDILKLGEIKEAEIKWSGIEDFVKEKQQAREKISKQEVLDFLKANELKIEEVEKGDRPLTEDEKIELKQLAKNLGYSGGRPEKTYSSLAEKGKAVKRFNELNSKELEENTTKYQNYTLPGGERYKELLFTLPQNYKLASNEKLVRQNESDKNSPLILTRDGEVVYNTDATNEKEALENLGQLMSKGQFKSPHFDEPNIIAHARVDDRVTADGKKILFIEELQSDYSIVARKFRGEIKNSLEDKTTFERIIAKGIKTLPSLPFENTWHEFVLKNMLRKAAEAGYDGIGWTTGEQQAERYDLSKVLDYINWRTDKDAKLVDIKQKGESSKIYVKVVDGKVVSTGGTLPILGKDLSDLVGKDLAKKILEEEKGELKGLDLKVGGEWAKTLYDQVIPNFLSKYAKKWGSKVGEIELEKRFDEKEVNKDTPYGEYVTDKIHFLPITPEMKQSVMYEGQPLFSVKKGQKETEARREQGQEATPSEMMDGNVVDFGVGLGQGFTRIADKIESKLHEKEFRDKWGISDNDYNAFKKYYREIMTAPQWFFDKEPQLRKVWDIIDRHLIRDVNEDIAIIREDKWQNGKPFRKLNDTGKRQISSAIEAYDNKQYKLSKFSEPLELETFEKFSRRFTNPEAKDFIMNVYKPTIEQSLEYLKDLDKWMIVNENITKNPFLEDYHATKKKEDKKIVLEEAKRRFFEAGPNNEDAFDNALSELKKSEIKGDIEVKALEKVWRDENIRYQSAESLVDEKYKEYEGKFYFPSSRLGDKYYLTAIKKPDPKEALLEGTPTERFFTTNDDTKFLDAKAEELKGQGYEVNVGEFKKNQEEILKNNVTQEDIIDLAILNGIEPDNKVIDRLIKSIISKGFTKHFIPKRYIPGFNYTTENIEKAIYNTIGSVAYFKNRTIGNRSLEKTIGQLKNSGILKPGSANDKYIEGLRNRLDTRDEGFSRSLRAVASLWYLSLRPSYIAQQIVQPINTLMPYLPVVAKELGIKQFEAEKAFAQSFLDTHRYYAWKILDKINRMQGKQTNVNFGLEPEFLSIMKSLERQGIGRPLRTLEIIGETVDPQRYYNTGRTTKALTGIAKVVGLPGIFIEDITRAQGIRAYWMMGKKAGLKGQELEDFISRSIAKSYGPASGRLSKPPFYNIPGDKKILTGLRALMDSHLTFKNFAFMNYGQWGKNFRALRDDHLIRPLMYKFAAQAGLGGFKYMMWVSSILTFLSAIYAMFDIPEEPREQYKDLFMQLNKLYDGLGDGLYKGLSSITFDVDLSALFSQQAPFASEEYEFEQSIPGVIGGAGIESLIEPAEGLVEGKTKKMLPSGIKNIRTAKKYLEEGIRFGTRKLIPKEEITKQDVLKKELGFTPVKISEAYEEERSRQFKSSQLTDIIRDYVSDKIIPLIEKNKNGEARKEFDNLYNQFKNRKDILTEKQREEVKTSKDFLNKVIMQRLDGIDRETVKEWKKENIYDPNRRTIRRTERRTTGRTLSR